MAPSPRTPRPESSAKARLLVRVGRVGVIALAATASACSAATSSFDGNTYRDAHVAFQTGPVPRAWRRVDVAGATLAFRDDPHGATTMVNARCDERDDDVPLAALTAHLVMGTTERKFIREETIPFDGREARHEEMEAKLDGVLLAYDLYVIKKDGCVYDFAYVAPPSGYAAGAREFERFAAGFHSGHEARATSVGGT